ATGARLLCADDREAHVFDLHGGRWMGRFAPGGAIVGVGFDGQNQSRVLERTAAGIVVHPGGWAVPASGAAGVLFRPSRGLAHVLCDAGIVVLSLPEREVVARFEDRTLRGLDGRRAWLSPDGELIVAVRGEGMVFLDSGGCVRRTYPFAPDVVSF